MILNWVIYDNLGVSRPGRESWDVCIFWIIYLYSYYLKFDVYVLRGISTLNPSDSIGTWN